MFDLIQLALTQNAQNYEKECTDLINYFKIIGKPHKAIQVAISCLRDMGRIIKAKREFWQKKVHEMLKADDQYKHVPYGVHLYFDYVLTLKEFLHFESKVRQTEYDEDLAQIESYLGVNFTDWCFIYKRPSLGDDDFISGKAARLIERLAKSERKSICQISLFSGIC